jgi:hypothetical protein
MGIGNIFASYLSGALRNPGAAHSSSQTFDWCCSCRSHRSFALVVALILIFVA